MRALLALIFVVVPSSLHAEVFDGNVDAWCAKQRIKPCTSRHAGVSTTRSGMVQKHWAAATSWLVSNDTLYFSAELHGVHYIERLTDVTATLQSVVERDVIPGNPTELLVVVRETRDKRELDKLFVCGQSTKQGFACVAFVTAVRDPDAKARVTYTFDGRGNITTKAIGAWPASIPKRDIVGTWPIKLP
jgi:hypothetical protein